MESLSTPIVDSGVAEFVLPGQAESGDRYLIRCRLNGVLIAAIDGIGHGDEAASAAMATVSVLDERADEPIISLVERCHDRLRWMRGAVLSLASIDPSHGLITWLGVGNVQGILMRGEANQGKGRETLLLRSGVVGRRLPALQATVLPIAAGDTVYFVTDGVRSEFADSLGALENPQKAADRILAQFLRGNDDALVLVVRFCGRPL